MTTMTTDPWDEFYRRSIPTPPHVYRRRRLVLVIILGIAAILGAAIADGAINHETPPANSPDILERVLNGSSDGRVHTCGLITEDGVTEYLDAYAARCGDLIDTDTTEGR